jgi:uncharacterized protein (DUF1501 family)
VLSRRRFLTLAGGVAAGSAAAGAGAWAALLRDHVDESQRARSGEAVPGDAAPVTGATGVAATAAHGKVLVVVQLGGGNDALNTLVPADGRYRDARRTLAIPEAQLVPVAGIPYGLHPALAPLATRLSAGQVAALYGLGFRSQTRSHFTAMDTWWAGTDGAASTTGWLGRWLDATEGPTPNPLRAISLGTGAPALIGTRSLPTVVLSPSQFALRAPRGTDARSIADAFMATAAPAVAAPWHAAAQAAVPTALDAIAMLERVRAQAAAAEPDEPATPGTTPNVAPTTVAPTTVAPTTTVAAGARPAADSATSLLQVAAGIIELDLGTRVLLVGMNGFDTHAGQADRQADLLADLASGITAFFDRLERSGLADRVLLVTTSEFGRRVAENGSGGTDHGQAGVQFLASPALRGGRVVGEPGLDRLVDGDLPIGIDTRSLYSVALDWLGGPTDEVLGGRYDRYGLL